MVKNSFHYFLLPLLLLAVSCSEKGKVASFSKGENVFSFENSSLKIVFDQKMNCNVYRKLGDKLLSVIQAGEQPHYLVINGEAVKDFTVDKEKIKLTDVETNYGRGKRLQLSGTADGPLGSVIEKTLFVELYESFPNAALFRVEYRNTGTTPGLFVEKEVNNSFTLDATLVKQDSSRHSFWILQGGSYDSRPDWILPVSKDFSSENYQGQNWKVSESGGGLPLLDVWNEETGFFIGSVRDKPTLLSLPARVNAKGYLEISIQYNREGVEFEDVYRAIPTVVGVHGGDFYDGLKTYKNIMEYNGFKMIEPDSSSSVYDAVFCAWGFGPNFTKEQIMDILPQVGELGLKVVTIDMGWFYINGDYQPRDNIFPAGDADMKKFTDSLHEKGLKVKLWITPNIAGPKLIKEHPEWLLRDKDGKPLKHGIYLTADSAAYLCPAVKEVQEYHRQLTETMIGEWGYDGFKVDQSLVNSVGRCYAESHNHDYPEESVEALPEIYKIMAETALSIKPDAILEVCPCGMFPDFYKMPYYNQPISSDPNTPWQTRHRAKVLKALMGPRAAYLGDMVERRVYKESNFATMVGVGGIPETMFTLTEEDNFHILRKKFPGYLNPQKKKDFAKWFALYQKYKLSNGEYLNLYDIAYDKPEAHVIEKESILYYAFYAANWNGDIEFRGLDNKNYIIYDYVNDIEIGKIRGNDTLKLSFKEFLLVCAIPIKN
jgi:alpha-galactosidase